MNNELMQVEFESLSGITVRLDADTVRSTLAKGNGHITDQEIAMFLRTCQAKKLDPLENGEVFLIKYDDKAPAQLVIGCHAYIRRADNFPDYRGYKAGITVLRQIQGQTPEVIQKEGSCVYKALGEQLIGGWCKVFRERYSGSIEETFTEVSMDEYNTGKANWSSKPATMIRKCAVSQAFRDAFPNEYEGLYTTEEMQASGAIPAEYKVVEATGEVVEVAPGPEPDEDPKVTQEQRKALFKMAKDYLGEKANEALKQMISDAGCESTNELKVSAYKNIMEKIVEIGLENRENDRTADEGEMAE